MKDETALKENESVLSRFSGDENLDLPDNPDLEKEEPASTTLTKSEETTTFDFSDEYRVINEGENDDDSNDEVEVEAEGEYDISLFKRVTQEVQEQSTFYWIEALFSYFHETFQPGHPLRYQHV
jgi:hypothetical protein